MAPVLIIGGGVAGLCLAQGLRKLNIDFKVFERDSADNCHRQGYRVRLVEGADVIEKVTPPEIVKLFSATCAANPTSMTKVDPITGEALPIAPIVVERMRKMKSSTVDRTVLRQIFLTDIADKVEFGKSFTHYQVQGEEVTAYFSDGTSEAGRLLIGCDGRSSKVRKQFLPEHNMLDTDGCVFWGKTPSAPEIEALREQEKLGPFTLFVDSVSLKTPMAMMAEHIRWSQETRDSAPKDTLPDDYTFWAMTTRFSSLPVSKEEATAISGEELRKLTLELTKAWDTSAQKLLEHQDVSQTTLLSINSVVPDMDAWQPLRHVMVIGDALHYMLPTAAVGANTALEDVGKLLAKIQQHGMEGLTEEVIGDFEADMRERAKQSIFNAFSGGAGSFGQKRLEECEVVKGV